MTERKNDGRIKMNLFEVLRGERTIPQVINHLDEEMRGVLGRDVRAFLDRTVSGALEDQICFVRVPKCATTSVHTEITRAYRSLWCFPGNGLQHVHPGACDDAAEGLGDDVTTWDVRRRVLSYFLAHPKTSYTWGHVCINEQILTQFGGEYSFITTIRNPVDRWLSHYLYNKHRAKSDPRYDIHTGIEKFLDTERGRGIGQMYIAYFAGAGSASYEERESDELQQKARENLKRFDLVGFVDDFPRFQRQFENRFDAEMNLRKRNTSPAPEGAKDISEDLRDQIREVCSADMEFYEWAKDEYLN
ncbi:MAG: sulfotransferase family 2 domain-containing protein [Bradymonadaceae bacterium]